MATRPSAAVKRVSTVTAADLAPRPPCKVHTLAVISDKAQITGSHPVEIGENTVLHPYAKIRSDHGSVRIGKNCTVSEKAVVGRSQGDDDVVIGDGVNIETGAIVEALSVGDGTVIEVGAVVGKGAVLGKHCKITPMNSVEAGESLPDFTVIFGDGQRRLDKTLASNLEMRNIKQKGQEMHVELLKRLIPNAAAKYL